jgi:peptidoglycan pentaglycine glycine transferase (the first glycine)
MLSISFGLRQQPEVSDANRTFFWRSGEGSAPHVLVSSAFADEAWDHFLEFHPQGQFQQTSRWARFKQADGWKVMRLQLRRGDRILGGLQLLYRATRFGMLGYVSKGPIMPELPLEQSALFGAFASICNELGLRAVLFQAPDNAGPSWPTLAWNLLPAKAHDLIQVTLLRDLRGGAMNLYSDLRRNTAQEIRQAKRRGVSIRETNANGIPCLFELMTQTCRRRNSKPNPATLEALMQLWQSFAPSHARLTIAEAEGQAKAALLCLMCGDRITLWKTGWDFASRPLHAHKLILFEAMAWGAARGFHWCDFGSFDPRLTTAGSPAARYSASQLASGSFAHWGFRGVPFRLPDPLIYISHPLLRWIYRSIPPAWIVAMQKSIAESP